MTDASHIVSATPEVATVVINGQTAGTLPLKDYEQLVAKAYKSPWLHVKQGAVLGWTCWKQAFSVLFEVPLFALVLSFWLFVSDPSLLRGFMYGITDAPTTELDSFVKGFAFFCFALVLTKKLFQLCFYGPGWFGYYSVFDIAINERIKEKVATSAEGPLSVRVPATLKKH